MYCTKCGKQIDAGSKFCEFCGAKVEDYSTDVKPKAKTPAKTVAAKKKETGDTKNIILGIFGLAFFVFTVVRMCSSIGGDDSSSSTDNTTQTEQTEQNKTSKSAPKDEVDILLDDFEKYISQSKDMYEKVAEKVL